ncbi:hypothetical protein [Virgibacillus kimchii]
MGLYINHNNHAGIFKNKGDIKAPNQGFFIKNHVAEMIQAQDKVNALMKKTIADLSKYQKMQTGEQQKKWIEVQGDLQNLLKMNARHEQVESYVMEQLILLEEKNKSLAEMLEQKASSGNKKVEEMYASHQQLLGKLTDYETEFKRLIGRIDRQAEMHEQLIGKMNEQADLQEQLQGRVNDQAEVQQELSEKVNKQENTQGVVLNRLENQEALTEKMLRQMDQFRSALFERTAFLAEKIEESIKFTSTYMGKMLPGSKDESTKILK